MPHTYIHTITHTPKRTFRLEWPLATAWMRMALFCRSMCAGVAVEPAAAAALVLVSEAPLALELGCVRDLPRGGTLAWESGWGAGTDACALGAAVTVSGATDGGVGLAGSWNCPTGWTWRRDNRSCTSSSYEVLVLLCPPWLPKLVPVSAPHGMSSMISPADRRRPRALLVACAAAAAVAAASEAGDSSPGKIGGPDGSKRVVSLVSWPSRSSTLSERMSTRYVGAAMASMRV